MTSILYTDVYSKFYLKIEGYDLFDTNVTDEMRDEFLRGYLHSAVIKPYVSRLFSSIALTDPYTDEAENPDYDPTDPDSQETIKEYHEGSINFEMKYDDSNVGNAELVSEIFAYGMALAWLEPKVNTYTNIAQHFTTSDEKYYSQAAHISELRSLRDDLKVEQQRLVQIRGYFSNEYLDGTAASASLRG